MAETKPGSTDGDGSSRSRGLPSEPRGPSVSRSVSRSEWLAVALVGALALALRVGHVLALETSDPFFYQPSLDAKLYHEWAQAIANGDWLGSEVFFHGPLYAYALAALYALVGPSILAAKLAQALLGAGACVLTWALGRRLFAPSVAVGGAALLAVAEMPVFYTGTLLLANAALFLGVVAMLGVVLALERPSAPRWLAAGLAVGLATITRPNALLFAAVCAAWLPFALRSRPWRQRGAWLVAFGAGGLLAVAPVTLRNYVVGGDFVLVTYSGGLNLYLGNNPDTDGSFRVPRILPRSFADDPLEQIATYRSLAEELAGRPLRPSEVSDVWAGEALRFMREAPGPWLRIVLRKLDLALNAFEPWNIRSLTLSRDFSPVLRLPLVPFGLLAPAAFLGLWLTARRWRALVPLYAWALSVFGTLVVFFVLSRYRVPALPALALFASAGLVEGWKRAREPRGMRRIALPLAGALIFAWATHRVVAREDLSIALYNLGNRYRVLGDWDRAIETYLRALSRNPAYVPIYNNLALTYEATGRHDADARRTWERVRELGESRRLDRYVERAERHLRALDERTKPPDEP